MKPYLIDNIPATARDIIKMAEALDDEFANEQLKRTSVAAEILRAYGHDVSENNT